MWFCFLVLIAHAHIWVKSFFSFLLFPSFPSSEVWTMILTWYQRDTTHLDFFFLLLCSFGFYFSLFRFLSIFIFLRKFQQIYHHCFLLFISLFFNLFSPCSFSQENFCSVIPFFLELDLVKKFLPVLNFLKVFHGFLESGVFIFPLWERVFQRQWLQAIVFGSEIVFKD